jgi:hypothetical protein
MNSPQNPLSAVARNAVHLAGILRGQDYPPYQ